MWQNKLKLKSFTLTEVMVALLISSIVFALASFSIINIQKQVFKFELTSNHFIEKERFYCLLNKDFQSNVPQQFASKTLTISNDNKHIQYQFNEKVIRIQNENLDTFTFHINEVNYFVDNVENTLHLDLILDNSDSFHFEKELGIQDLVNNKTHGISN